MVSFTSLGLKSQARERLRDNGANARKLVFIHTGVVVLLSLISSGLSIYLDDQIGATGGLSGLGTRSILQTIQTMLQYITTLFSPFWTVGFLTVATIWAADRQPQTKDLLNGFRRFSSVIGYEFLLSIMTLFLMLGTGYAAGTIFAMTPFADPLLELMEPFMASGSFDTTLLPMDQLLNAYLPFLIMWLAVMIPILAIFLYSVRLSLYFIIDYPGMGAVRAMATSASAMRGRKLQLFKLDLSFWWYYALELVLMFVCYLDLILPLLGIQLPFNATVGYFFFLALYGVLQLVLHIWKKPEIETTYALAYHFITHPDHMDPPQFH